MMMRKIILFIALFCFCGTVGIAQARISGKLKPQWFHKLPKPGNSSFIYEVFSASASSLEAARTKCLTELISNSSMKSGMLIFSDYKSNELFHQEYINGELKEKVEYTAKTETSTKTDEARLYVKKIDEYLEKESTGNYNLTILYAKSELKHAPLFDDVELTTAYGFHGLWRSAIVPGWGQFYKGANLKGGLILGGCAALIAGIIFTENQRSDYVRKIVQTHSADLKRDYATKRDHFTTGRNICIGACAALYIYNLVDAIAAPGARRVVVNSKNRRYAVAPVILPKSNIGLATHIIF